ncbi:MAG TPA: hypothetical protein VLA34_03895, partial [Candidatus Krumholzibacterium sp.]|nr:hypothetical protein [Candidatus Krumholzibacterium sp.]
MAALLLSLGLVAICIPAGANTLGGVDDPVLGEYTRKEIERGAPSLYVTSRVVYRQALEILERG